MQMPNGLLILFDSDGAGTSGSVKKRLSSPLLAASAAPNGPPPGFAGAFSRGRTASRMTQRSADRERPRGSRRAGLSLGVSALRWTMEKWISTWLNKRANSLLLDFIGKDTRSHRLETLGTNALGRYAPVIAVLSDHRDTDVSTGAVATLLTL